MSTYHIQMQDHEGNNYNPHTNSGVVSHKGKSLEEVVDKKLDTVNKYVHPNTPTTRHTTDTAIEKLANIEERANRYLHPETDSVRHVTDLEKEKWNNEQISQFLNDSDYQTLSDVNTLIAALAGSAPETLDTLMELAKALGNDPNFATTMTTLLAMKEALIKNATPKLSIVDNDTLPLSDSANSSTTKKVKFSTIKATLKSYFDSLYSNINHNHNLTYYTESEINHKVTELQNQINDLKTAQGGIELGIDSEGYLIWRQEL